MLIIRCTHVHSTFASACPPIRLTTRNDTEHDSGAMITAMAQPLRWPQHSTPAVMNTKPGRWSSSARPNPMT